MNLPSGPRFALEAARAEDFEALLALRLRAMRQSLTQLGRYDEQRARERLASGFDVASTQHIVVAGERVGFIMLKRLSHALRLDHFYIDPPIQRQGIGAAVLARICAQADEQLLPLELCALKGSKSNRFYLHHGFAMTGEGEWDNDYLRMPVTPSLRAVRGLWAHLQDGDWAAARTALRADLVVNCWTSGERFTGAEAFIEANARDPGGRQLHLIELVHLQDGRVMTLVRVDLPPATFFATSFFRVDDGLITAIDEYWAAAEHPPEWRAALPGRTRFDPQDDARARAP